VRSRPRWLLPAAGLVLAVLLAAGGWAAWYRSTYHLWPGESIPPRIHWCGRDYDHGIGPAVSIAEVRQAIGGPPRIVMRVPPLRPHDVLAATTEREVRRQDPAATGCATVIALRLSPGRFLLYELQGSL
jgi:hypothetical protein